MSTKIFVNLPVKDLNKSKEFFSKLGYTFNPQFTDENGACLVISEEIYAMLLTEKFFKTFIKKDIVDAKKSSEAILALTCESREEVDAIYNKAVQAGGKSYRDGEDNGWMYTKTIEDLDGHQWEFFYMDMSKVPKT